MAHPLPITQTARAQVAQALKRHGMSRIDLARSIGVAPPWVSRFFSGELKTLTPEKRVALESALRIQLMEVIEEPHELPAWLLDLQTAAETHPAIHHICLALLDLAAALEQDPPARAAEDSTPYKT